MNSIISVWANDPLIFEQKIPLEWLGRHIRGLGSSNNIHIVFLEGLSKLPFDYIQMLKNLNYDLIDGSEIYNHISKNYDALNRFGDYEKKCFLRWLIIREIFGTAPIIHYDADIVFNESPETITKYFGPHVFVLQGCPAFVTTGGSEWLSEYKKQLDIFIEDIETYSEKAWQERKGSEISYRTKWAGCRSRKIISSDQDLISHLIHTDRLPQEVPSQVLNDSNLLLFENPLYFFSHYLDLMPIRYRRIKGIDYFNNKKIAFWHMQSDFIKYLSFYLQRGRLNKFTRCINPLEQKTAETYLWKIYNQLSHRKLSRLAVYRYFFESNDFSEVFNDNIFWKQSVFI